MISIHNLCTTIGDLLSRQSERSPDREALVHVDWGTRYTYAQLDVECDRLARTLMGSGIAQVMSAISMGITYASRCTVHSGLMFWVWV